MSVSIKIKLIIDTFYKRPWLWHTYDSVGFKLKFLLKSKFARGVNTLGSTVGLTRLLFLLFK